MDDSINHVSICFSGDIEFVGRVDGKFKIWYLSQKQLIKLLKEVEYGSTDKSRRSESETGTYKKI
jgi:hypothetical protein